MCSGHLRAGDVERAVVCFNPMAPEHVLSYVQAGDVMLSWQSFCLVGVPVQRASIA